MISTQTIISLLREGTGVQDVSLSTSLRTLNRECRDAGGCYQLLSVLGQLEEAGAPRVPTSRLPELNTVGDLVDEIESLNRKASMGIADQK